MTDLLKALNAQGFKSLEIEIKTMAAILNAEQLRFKTLIAEKASGVKDITNKARFKNRVIESAIECYLNANVWREYKIECNETAKHHGKPIGTVLKQRVNVGQLSKANNALLLKTAKNIADKMQGFGFGNDQIEIQLPFSGFYESYHDLEIDAFIEQESEENAESSSYLNPALVSDLDYKTIRENLCKLYMQAYNNAFLECYNIDLKLEYSRLSSPRFYNFDTDKLYCYVDKLALNEAFNLVDKDKLESQLKQRYSPQSGFMPFADTLQAIQKMDLVFFASEALESLLSENDVLNEFYHYSDNIYSTIMDSILDEFWIYRGGE